MTLILTADVGGTNSRLALMEGGRIAHGPARCRNEDFAAFEDVARRFLSDMGASAPDAVCVAVAGPVQGGVARLTNRDWTIDGAALAAALGAARGIALNDLAAQGLGLRALGPDGAAEYLPAATPAAGTNGQAVVAGFGTGMNLCVVRRLPSGAQVHFDAEYGHCALSSGVLAEAPEGILPAAAGTPEHWFSGRGISALHARLTGETRPSEEIVAAAEAGAPGPDATLRRFARMAGALCRDLALQFLPQEGIYLSGGAARGAMLARHADAFAAVYLDHPLFPQIPAAIPVRIVTDDDAALQGCAAAAEQALTAL